jgi:hypothetical protein
MESFIITIAIIANLLTGTVSDKSSKELLAGVKVQYGTTSVYTNLDGEFTMPLDTTRTLFLRYISYNDTIINLDNTKENVGQLLK